MGRKDSSSTIDRVVDNRIKTIIREENQTIDEIGVVSSYAVIGGSSYASQE